jgi:hypothetical protein
MLDCMEHELGSDFSGAPKARFVAANAKCSSLGWFLWREDLERWGSGAYPVPKPPPMVVAAVIAAWFVACDAANFSIVQMVVALVLITGSCPSRHFGKRLSSGSKTGSSSCIVGEPDR